MGSQLLLLLRLFVAGALFSYNVSCLFATDTRLESAVGEYERERKKGETAATDKKAWDKKKEETGRLSSLSLFLFLSVSDVSTTPFVSLMHAPHVRQ